MDWMHRDVVVEHKAGPDDLVSEADRDSERTIRDVLSRRRPHDAVRGEEGDDQSGTSGITWVVDPIDGTTSYLYGRADWSVSVAAVGPTGEVVAAAVVEPVLGLVTHAWAGGGTWQGAERVAELASAQLARALVELNLGRPDQKHRSGQVLDALVPRIRDVRRGGSAAAALARLATGRADAAWLPGLKPWDCAAGVLLVTEAGGVVGDLEGSTGSCVPDSGDVLAASVLLWPQLRELLHPVWT
ncbi:MAG: hypothetical protein JWO12_3345 [Frankiales bacterium]|nr:hypothetical protein [Frankiales bacterium]